jgi:hypothetical protein
MSKRDFSLRKPTRSRDHGKKAAIGAYLAFALLAEYTVFSL